MIHNAVPAHTDEYELLPVVSTLEELSIPVRRFCQGHLQHGTQAPWIEIAYERPDEQFEEEQEVLNRIALKYGITGNEVKDLKSGGAFLELMRALSVRRETKSYQAWKHRNSELKNSLARLIESFYSQRTVSPAEQLRLHDQNSGASFVLHNGGNDYWEPIPWYSVITSEEGALVQARLSQYRSEIREFGRYLTVNWT